MNTLETMGREAAVRRLVAELAYEYWESHGRQHGHDLADWYQAEQEVLACLKLKGADEETSGPAGEEVGDHGGAGYPGQSRGQEP